MGWERYVTADVTAAVMVLACSHSMGRNDYGAATVWSEWDASNRHRIIAAKIGRSIFERIGIIRSLGPAAI